MGLFLFGPCFLNQYLSVLSSFAIILLRKKELATLYFGCLVTVSAPYASFHGAAGWYDTVISCLFVVYIVKTITPRCHGRPDALLHEAEGRVQLCTRSSTVPRVNGLTIL